MTEPRTPPGGPSDDDLQLRELAQGLWPELCEAPEVTFPTANQLRERAELASRRRRAWTLRGGAFLAAAAVMVAVMLGGQLRGDSGVPIPRPSDGPPIAEPDYGTARNLLLASSAAAARQETPSATSRYWRTDTSVTESGRGDWDRVIWLGRHTPGVLIDDGRLTRLPPSTFRVGDRPLSWEEFVNLDSSVAELRRLLFTAARERGQNPGWFTLREVGGLLTETPASPELRSSLWRVAASIPGVAVDGKAVDRQGRTGWSYSLSKPGRGKQQYIVEPDTGTLLESRDVAPDGSTFVRTYLQQEPADDAPEVPKECRDIPCPLPPTTVY